EMAARIEEYNNMLNDQVNMVYEERKNFDESVTMINNRLAGYLDAKQEEAQAMFPHYFERYKTDGVEYNMYIGESIVNELTYHPLYLSNLRLWQLLVMCEMEFEFFKLQEELYTPLEVASLILVYGNSLAIHFRMDEKRFDVEGAYNARYEIVKKRVDKAHIKGTKERVTVPKKIAIIYSSEQDVLEYRKYIQFLQSIGYLKNTLEELQLEDLQGITGLKALRVELDYSQATKDQVTYSEIMEAMNPEATEA
ncbi:MAG: GAF domain-containing protein, partial [Bacteroidota bacterium]